MRKWTSYGFIWLSVILLIGHSLVPHVHVCSSETVISSNLCHAEQDFGILSKLYSVDLGGEGHLQNFLQIRPYSVELGAENGQIANEAVLLLDISSLFFQNAALGVEKNSFPVEKRRVLISRTSLSERLLRAPPAC